MGSEGLTILSGARKHGIEDEDMFHAVAFAVAVFDQGDGMMMHVGPARSSTMLEVGVVVLRDGRSVIAHAMRARSKYLNAMGW